MEANQGLDRTGVTRIRQRFEAELQAGLEPSIEDFLTHVPAEDFGRVVEELLAAELRYHFELGTTFDIARYIERFPQCEQAIKRSYDVQRARIQQTMDYRRAQCDPGSAFPAQLGRYRVVSVLGQGSFGTVLLGMDEVLGRQVAVKIPRAERISNKNLFLDEARLLATLAHPHIVPIYDVGETEGGQPFIVCQYIDGTSLDKVVGSIVGNYGQAASVAVQIAEALHCAHSKGLVHRDVKPANILMDRDGKAYLTDFGLGLPEAKLGTGPVWAGTPAYMSPEQARGEAHLVDGRSDIFSLGAVLYELLAGVRPFDAASAEETLYLIKNAEVRPPRQRNVNIPAQLERVCLKALAKRLQDRYTTAYDFANDLRKAMATDLGSSSRTASRVPTVGCVLAGKWELLACQKIDVLGNEFKAVDVASGTELTVSVGATPLGHQRGEREEFVAKATRLQSLRHPHIAKLLDFTVTAAEDGVLAGLPVAVFEFVEGVRLKDLAGRLSDAQLKAFVQQIGGAIAHAHAERCVHGDIHSANVVVVEHGTPDERLLLVGLGKGISNGGETDASCRLPVGSVDGDGYVSPEHLKGARTDERTDVFQFAATFYELLTGERPYKADFPSIEECVNALLLSPAPSFERALHQRNLPGGLAPIFNACTSREPEARPKMTEVVERCAVAWSEPNTIVRPIPNDADEIEFTVYRPRTLSLDHWHKLLVFAHLQQRPDALDTASDPIEEVRQQAAQIIGAQIDKYRSSTQESGEPVLDGSVLTFVPAVPGVDFEPPRRSFVWRGVTHHESFDARAYYGGSTLRGKLSIFMGSLLIAEVNLVFTVDAAKAAILADSDLKEEPARRFRRIFASHSPDDTAVAMHVRTYAAAIGDDFWSRWLNLRGGDQADETVKRLIEEADVFQLFWSRNAMRSPAVEGEWQHALSLGRDDFIKPVFWEAPFPEDPARSLPPTALRKLPFVWIGDPANSAACQFGASGVTTSKGPSILDRLLDDEPTACREAPPSSVGMSDWHVDISVTSFPGEAANTATADDTPASKPAPVLLMPKAADPRDTAGRSKPKRRLRRWLTMPTLFALVIVAIGVTSSYWTLNDSFVTPPINREPPMVVNPEPSSAEQSFSSAAEAVRQSLIERDFQPAQAQTRAAMQHAASEEQRQLIRGMQSLTTYVERFWAAFDEGLRTLDRSEKLRVGSASLSVVDFDQDYVVIRTTDRTVRYPTIDLPPEVAIAIAKRSLDQEVDGRILVGALYFVHPQGDVTKARQLWEDAERTGLDVKDLLSLLRLTPGKPDQQEVQK